MSGMHDEALMLANEIEHIENREFAQRRDRREANYGNLPPRSYRFHVIASDNSGLWNTEGAAFDFSVEPAYYQATWFLALCVMSSLAILAAYRLRLR